MKNPTFVNILTLLLMYGMMIGGVFGETGRSNQAAPADEILFIDDKVQDYHQLVLAARPGVEVVKLESAKDEFAQMADALKGRHSIKAVHLVCHGKPGALMLGTSSLDAGSLGMPVLDSLRSVLDARAEVMLYGCDVASGAGGARFVRMLSARLGAVVRASSDKTGSASLGGDWDLEVSTGHAVIRPLFDASAAYPHLLPQPRVESYQHQLWVRPGEASYTWTIGPFTDSNGTSQPTQVAYGNVPDPGVQWFLNRGVFQYSTNNGASWTNMTVNNYTSLVWYNIAGSIFRFVDQSPGDPNNDRVGHYMQAPPPHYGIGGSGTNIIVDNPPTDITSDAVIVLDDTMQGQTIATLTPVDTGLFLGGHWAIDSQSVSNLFTIHYDNATSNTATLRLGTGTMPAPGSTATVTVRYYDPYDTDSAGQPIPGDGFSKQLTYEVLNNATQDLNFNNESVVNTYTTDAQNYPAIATLSNGNYVIVWESLGQGKSGNSVGGVYARVYNSMGVAQGSPFVISNFSASSDERLPAVTALNDGRFAVAYMVQNGSDYDVAMRLVEAGGSVGSQIKVNTAAGYFYQPSIITLNDGSILAGYSDINTGDLFVQQLAAANGAKIGGEITILTGDAYLAGLAPLDNGGYVVSWIGYSDGLVSFKTSTGSSPVNTGIVSAYYVAPRLVQMTGGFLLVTDVYDSVANSTTIQAASYSNAGTVVVSPMVVPSETQGNRYAPSAARLSNGDVIVAWQSLDDLIHSGVFGRRLDASLAPLDAQDFQINEFRSGDQSSPAVTALADDVFAAAWADTSNPFTSNANTEVETRVLLPSTSSTAPTVTTATQSGVTHNSATLGGNVSADGGAEVMERGIVWGLSADPTTSSGTKVQMSSGTGPFSQLVTSLPSSTTVHVRAYAINSAGTAYGGNISFATSAAPPAVRTLFYIDSDNSKEDILRVSPDGSGNTPEIVVNAVGGQFPNILEIDNVGERLFWFENETDRIFRANLDGTGITTLVTLTSTAVITDLAYDAQEDELYLINSDPAVESIMKVDASGANETPVTVVNSANIGGQFANFLAIDTAGRRLFWFENDSDAIYRSGMDGSGRVVLVSFTSSAVITDMEYDPVNQEIYFIDSDSAKEDILKVSANGSNNTPVLVVNDLGGQFANSLAVDVAANQVFWWENETDIIYRSDLTGAGRVSLVVLTSSANVTDIELFIPPSSVAAPTVTTATQSGVTHNSATLGGNVSADGGAEVTERGIVWGLSADPTTSSGTKAQMSSGTGPFSQLVTGLPSSTTVHVRAYAINSAGTSYGGNISFMTSASAPEIAVSETGVGDIADGGSFGFGATTVGTPVTKTFTVTNSGTANLTLSNLSVPSGFSLAQNFGSTTVTPSENTTFQITLSATGTGSPSGSLSFTTNDSDENPFNFTISGTVSAPAPTDPLIIGNVATTDSGTVGFDGNDTLAAGFTVGGTAQELTAVSLELDATVGGTNPTVSLYSDSSGVPGSLVVGLTPGASLVLNNEQAYHYTPSSPFTLLANTTYWIVLEGGAATGAWRRGDLYTETAAVHFGRAVKFNGEATWTFTAGTSSTSRLKYDVRGTAVADTTPPVLSSFTRQVPMTATTSADSLVFRATFNEGVQNVDAADFAVNGSTTATVTLVSPVSASVYDITVSGGDLAGFNGTVGLNLAGGQNIQDLAGNALPAGESAVDEVFTVENLFPEIAVDFAGNDVADGSPTPAALNGTDFGSVPVAGVTLDHVFTITNSGTAALTVGTVSATGDFSVQAQPSGSVAAGGGTTTFTIRFDPSTTGARAGTVSFGTNDGDENPFNFSVQGTGTGPQTFDLAGNAISNTPYDGGETYIYTTNSAPTDITLTPSSIAENNAPGAAVGALAAVDANLADAHTFELVAGGGDADNGSFTIDGVTLELDVTADHETKSSYSIRVRATDSGAGNLAFEKELTVGVTDVNEAPQITSNGGGASGAVSVEENATVVTTVTATDEDLPAQTLSFSISGGADQALFSIHGSTGMLSFITAPDFENPKDAGGDNVYDVVVQAVDDGTGTLAGTQSLAVTVTDVNDAPTIGGYTLVYEVTNPVRVANNIEYAVNNAAALSGSSFSRVRYRMQTTVAGEVRYADVSFDAWPGLTVEGLRVPTPNDPFIVQRNVDNLKVESNYPGVVNAGAQTGRLEIWNHNYTRTASGGVGGSNDLFDFDDTPSAGSHGSFQVHNLSSAPPQTVLAWNSHGSVSPDVGFGNRPVSEPDWTFAGASGLGITGWKLQIYIDGSAAEHAAQVAENTTAVMTVEGLDQDLPPQTLTYSLAGGADEAFFSLDSSTGELAFLSAPDFENPADANTDNVYEVILEVTDDGTPSLSGTQTLHVMVANADEPPVIARDNASVTVNEGSQAANTGTFSDLDGNATVTLSASAGTVTPDNDAGTWSWAYTPADGPADSQTVTITADDGFNTPVVTTFLLTVGNVAPSYDLGLPDPAFLTPGSGVFARTVGFADPGADVWSGTVNYGAGGGSQALSVNQGARTFSLGHTYTQGGRYTVSVTLQDDEGGSQADSMEVDVILLPILVTGSATSVTAYNATLHGTVNPNHGTASVWFEYSTDSEMSTGVLSTTAQSAGTGTSALPASAAVAGLLADSVYYFRIAAENAAGVSRGTIMSFTTNSPVVSGEYLDPVDHNVAGGGEVYRPMPGVINQDGRIAFKVLGSTGTGGISTFDDSMLMSDASGSLLMVAREGTFVEEYSYLTGRFDNIVLTDGGEIVTTDKITGAPASHDQAYFFSPDGSSLEMFSREGDAAPDGGTFATHTGKPAVDANGVVYFSGDLNGMAANRNSGVWYDDGSGVASLAVEGDDLGAVLGDPGWLGNIQAMVSAGGDGAAFIVTLQNNPDDSKQKTATAGNAAILAGNSSGLTLVARKGNAAPGAGSTTYRIFNAVARGGSGGHAFISSMTTGGGVVAANDQVLVASTGGAEHLVAREGVTEIVSGLTLKSFGDFYMTDDGGVVFLAKLNGAATNADDVLCRWSLGGGLEMLAREGDAAPGAGANFGLFSGFSVSSGGAIALTSTLSDASPALFRALPGGALSLVIKRGDDLTVNGTLQTIYTIGIHGDGTGQGGGGGGMGAAVNDLGEIFAAISLGNGNFVARIFR